MLAPRAALLEQSGPMEWLFILALAGLAWLQSRRIGTLSRKLGELERLIGAAAPPPKPQTLVEREPLILDMPLRPGELEPLLLDTPLPEPSNDSDAVTPSPIADRPSAAATSKTPAKPPGQHFERWLAENGLAWLGACALILGVSSLVAVASQQGWFTPSVRLAGALVLATVLIGASEWTRRFGIERPPGHPLVAAMLAGAGVAALYAVVWAAHGLYQYIDWTIATALLLLCALVLVGLSFLHGQALGALAIFAAFLTPPLTSLGAWPAAALTLYLCAIGAAGFALTMLRLWPWAAVATLAGLYLWFAGAIAADELARALTLLSFASVGGLMLALREPNETDPGAWLHWARVRALGPSIALCVSSVLLIWTWLAAAPSARVVGPALVGVFQVALAAYALRARVAAAAALVVAIAALALGFALYLSSGFYLAALQRELYLALLLAALAIAASALAARPHRSARAMVAAAGAIGAGLLTAFAASSRPDWHGFAAWAALFAGSGIMFAAAWRSASEAQKPEGDLASDVWVGTGAALMLFGVESAIPDIMRPLADAGAALLLAAGFAWRGWRALRYAALSAAALSLAHALSPAFLGAVMGGALSLWAALALLGASAALLFAGSRVAAKRGPQSATSEALHGASVIALLIAAFLSLRWIAAGGAGAPLDAFTEAALRALTLLAAGRIVMPRAGQTLGHIGQWRGHALLGAGLFYILLGPTLALNPWWGGAPATIPGPGLFNVQALAFAAPAAIALVTAARLYASQPTLARLYAIAGTVLALVWLALEIRHGFHGARMNGASFIGLEGFAHALWPLTLALAVSALAPSVPCRADIEKALGAAVWPALAIAPVGLWLFFNPWWGWAPAQAQSTPAALIAIAAFVLAAWLSASAGRVTCVRWPRHFASAATIACVGHLFVAATLAVRRLYHSVDMSTALSSGIEAWTYSAVWALFGAAAFALGVQRDNQVLRWSGLAILFATTGYVAFLALTQLTDMVRVGALLGLAVVLLAVAWGARAYSPMPQPPEPLTLKRAARRERRHGRR